MASHGNKRHTKRLNVPSILPVSFKKEYTFVITPRAGPHPKKRSVALAIIVRDLLGLAKTMKEAKRIISSGEILVDGKPRKDVKFPVGLLDVISIPKLGKNYLFIPKEGKYRLVEIDDKKAKFKLAKIKNKYYGKKGIIYVALHDGKIMKGDNNLKVGDGVIISIPEIKLEKVLKIKEGEKALVFDGKHAGEVGKIKEVNENIHEVTIVTEEGREITTKDYYVVPVGDYL